MFERLQNWLDETIRTAKKSRRATSAKRAQARRRAQPLLLEALEDRTVPTVLFTPQFGNESPLKDGGQRFNSPNIYVVLWGSSWGSLVSPQAQQVFTATSAVVGSHYLDGLAQYGVTTNAHYKGLVFDNTPDPVSGFSQQSMIDEISGLIDTNQLPYPFVTPNMVVDMVTAPGINSDQANAAGYNNLALIGLKGISGIIWNGTSFGSLAMRDACSLIFSHELAETMTDPGGKGYAVNAGSSWPNPAANSSQIGDYEGNRYQYRLPTEVLVQPYWSAGKNTSYPTGWLITDGNVQTIYVKPNWTGSSFNNYDIILFGGQVATPNGDNLSIGNDDFGLTLALNNEHFQLDSDFASTYSDGSEHRQLGKLTANIAAGVVRINSSLAMTSITVNGHSGTRVDVTTTDAPLSVVGAGTVTVGAGGTLRGLGVVTIDGRSQTDLTINDAANQSPRVQYGVFGNTFNATTFSSFFSVGYSGLRSLTINGGSGGNTYDVMNTPSVATTLNSGSGPDTVTVRAATGALGINGQGGQDTVHLGYSGSVRQILSRLAVSNSSGYSAVDIDDSSDNVARTVIVYRQTTLGILSTIISGLTPGGDISLRSDRLSSLGIRTGAGGNTFRIHDTPFSFAPGGAVTTVNTGRGNDLVTIDGASGPLTIDGAAGSDTVNIGTGNLQTIGGSVTVVNSGGYSAVNVDDHADIQSARTVLMYNNGAANGISTVIDGFPTGGDIVLRGSDLSALSVRAGTLGNTFRIHDTPTSGVSGGLTTMVNTGAGSDMVTVDGTTGTLALNVQGGDDNVFIGSANGGLGRIQGAVTITGGGGKDALTFNDQVTTTQEYYSLTADQLTRRAADGFTADMAPISFASFKTVALNVGSGGSGTAVTGSLVGSTVTVNGNAGGQDVFAVDASSDAIQGPVTFNGQSESFDFAEYFDGGNAASHTYTLGSGDIRRDGLATVSTNVVALLFAPTVGGNTVNVKSVALGGAYKIQAANGDHVTVGSRAPGLNGTLANILDQVNVVSYTPDDAVTLVFDDSGNTDTTPKHISFSGFDADGNVSMSGLTPIAVSWNLPLASSVTVRGGAADETFSMQSVVSVTPVTIIGGTGINTLDYSSYTTDVTVNLLTGTATDLAGISDPNTGRVTIQNVIGGSGNDTLTAGTRRSILIGGGGADQLFGGSGQAILIGGTTDYTQPGLDIAALDAIFQEWNRTDLGFNDRVSDLMTGSNSGGVAAKNVVAEMAVLLNSSTVHDDLAADVLTGGTGRDWYFIDASDLIASMKAGDAVTTV